MASCVANEQAIQNVCLIRELFPSPTQHAETSINAPIPYCPTARVANETWIQNICLISEIIPRPHNAPRLPFKRQYPIEIQPIDHRPHSSRAETSIQALIPYCSLAYCPLSLSIPTTHYRTPQSNATWFNWKVEIRWIKSYNIMHKVSVDHSLYTLYYFVIIMLPKKLCEYQGQRPMGTMGTVPTKKLRSGDGPCIGPPNI